ncbi:MAG: hypothetical protein E7052_08620 [Lentisphaerae bacterium]|nr:hypothetical protein [Lentisphaerota bacterium]
MKNYILPATAAAMLLGANAMAGSAAAPYDNSRIDARLNVTVKEDTDVVHFVRDNADPNVITKAYIIKNVDPYELRSYLRAIVQTRKVNGDNTNVEAVKYTDGTSVLLISAEDYRFQDTPRAQGFDSIVKELDQPKLVASSGRKTYVYSPKYRSSQELMEMVNEVGAYSKNAVMNNVGGTDVMINDAGLNLIFFNTAPFSRETIMDVLAEYDKPYPAVRAKVTVYELYAENDTKLGLDFQAWKNNDGIDFFSVGGRFSQNHNGIDLVNNAKWNDTTYFQFNPKWNTKYVDFLTSKGKAKVLHTSEIDLRNNTTGTISKYTQVFVAKPTLLPNDNYTESYVVANVPAATAIAKDTRGNAITLNGQADVTVLKLGKDGTYKYTLRVDDNAAVEFVINGKNAGHKVLAQTIAPTLEDNLISHDAGHKRGNAITTEASNKFGFTIELTPSINTKATSLNVKIANTSLIGYTSDGNPRIQKGAAIDTDFMISNAGTKLVIGGIEKRSVMSVSGGVPILKDLPLLGWLFSTETEATKRSQLLVVAEVIPAAQGEQYQTVRDEVKQKLSKAGESNNYGYRQYLIDNNR